MDRYLVAKCSLAELKHEVLIAYLLSIGFESFEELEDSVDAYAPLHKNEDGLIEKLDDLAKRENISYSTTILEPKNWNAVWESNFDPVIVEDKLIIRAGFHDQIPGYEYEIIISPKMAFGTGHHETTYMMIKHMLNIELKNKEVLDYGSGTGILAVAASIFGAKHIVAVDIQDEAEENAKEHMSLNDVQNISVFTGDLGVVPLAKYDIILANINRNVIISTMADMKDRLFRNGQILISGIMKKDKNLVLNQADKIGLNLTEMDERGEWLFFNYSNKID